MPADKENQVNEGVLHLIDSCRSKKLDLSKKMLCTIPAPLLDLTNLEFLYLEGNQLQSLPDDFFASLIKLKWLDLRKNKLRCLPTTIGDARNLRSLLLEENELKRLPLELGLVESLSGLHLADNPLELPPASVIEQGTQVILAFLREQLYEDREDLKSGTSAEIHTRQASGSSEIQKDYHASDGLQRPFQKQNRRNSDPLSGIASSREENSAFRVVSSALASPATRAKRNQNFMDRIRREAERKRSQGEEFARPRKPKGKLKPLESTHSGKRVKNRVENKIQEEMKKAEQRKSNNQIDATIQKTKSKEKLEEWRKETRNLQRQKNRIAARNGIKQEPLHMPYGTENQTTTPATKHGQQVKDALENLDQSSLDRITKDTGIMEKIEAHMKKMRITAAARSKLTPSEEVEETKKNLQEALHLRSELEEQRALEYRLRAFTGDGYAPPSHAHPKGGRY